MLKPTTLYLTRIAIFDSQLAKPVAQQEEPKPVAAAKPVENKKAAQADADEIDPMELDDERLIASMNENPGALAAQLSAAFGVHVFSMIGIPVSTSQAVVGGVIGVGLTKGAGAVSMKKLSTIFIGWVATPMCAAIFAAVVYRLVA